MLVDRAWECVRVGEALVQHALEKRLGIEKAGFGEDMIGGFDVQVEGFVGRVYVNVEAVEIMPGAVVDALLDGRHSPDALYVLVRICTSEHLAVDDDGLEVGEALLNHPMYLKYTLAIATCQFLPLVEVFFAGYYGGSFGELDIVPVAEKTAIGAVYLFLYDETSSLRGMHPDLLHEGTVEMVLNGTVFFECQHRVFFAKVRPTEVRFQIIAKLAMIWKRVIYS